MSSITSTATTWGTMHVIVDEHGQSIRSVCKLCGHETFQILESGANPFRVVKPEHEMGCRFHPHYTPPKPVEPPRKARGGVQNMEPPAPMRAGVSRMELAWWAAALAGAGMLGALLG